MEQSEEGGSQHTLTQSFQFMRLWNWLPELDLLILTLTPAHAGISIMWILEHSYKAKDVSFLQTLLSSTWTSKSSPRTGPVSVKDMALGSVLGNSCFASMGSLPLNYPIPCQSWELQRDCSSTLSCKSEVAASGLPAPHVLATVLGGGEGPPAPTAPGKGSCALSQIPTSRNPRRSAIFTSLSA